MSFGVVIFETPDRNIRNSFIRVFDVNTFVKVNSHISNKEKTYCVE